jgi:hypothetical protein
MTPSDPIEDVLRFHRETDLVADCGVAGKIGNPEAKVEYNSFVSVFSDVAGRTKPQR